MTNHELSSLIKIIITIDFLIFTIRYDQTLSSINDGPNPFAIYLSINIDYHSLTNNKPCKPILLDVEF